MMIGKAIDTPLAMRVLLVNHGTAGDWGGGDGVQMRETGKRLHQRGHEVVAVNADQPDVRGFDIVHIFNCRIETSFRNRSHAAKSGSAYCCIPYGSR